MFANLTPPTQDAPPVESAQAHDAGQATRRPSRMRPVLGSPDLVDDGERSPVGAIGQSLCELTERSRRADENEKMLLSGQPWSNWIPRRLSRPSFRIACRSMMKHSKTLSMRSEGRASKCRFLCGRIPKGLRNIRSRLGIGVCGQRLSWEFRLRRIVRPLSDQEQGLPFTR